MKQRLFVIAGRIDHFFFESMTATGWGLMRLCWGFASFWFFLVQWRDVETYYTNLGLFPKALQGHLAHGFIFSPLLAIDHLPNLIFALYLLMLVLLLCSAVGLFARWTTIASFLLIIAFFHRNYIAFSGGGGMIRILGFLLAISPGIDGVSLDRMRRAKGKLLPPATMPIWPWRLLVWQTILLYLSAVSYKLTTPAWREGYSLVYILHVANYSRFSKDFADSLTPLLPMGTWITLAFQMSWELLFIPARWTARTPIRRAWLMRYLILGSIIFNGLVLILMRVADFAIVMLALTPGLLRDGDIALVKAWWKKRRSSTARLPYGATSLPSP